MKKALLILLISSACMISAAQTIQNTTWAGYSPSNVFFRYYYFTTDTAFFATSLPSFTAFSSFTTSGDTIVFHDLFGNCASIIGTYTYLIQNDTLRFTIVNDPCSARAAIFGSYYLVGILNGIMETNSIQRAEVFPNPSADGIFNLTFFNSKNENTELKVLNSLGEEVYTDHFSDKNKEQSVNLQNLPSGVYLLILQNADAKKIFKILR